MVRSFSPPCTIAEKISEERLSTVVPRITWARVNFTDRSAILATSAASQWIVLPSFMLQRAEASIFVTLSGIVTSFRRVLLLARFCGIVLRLPGSSSFLSSSQE